MANAIDENEQLSPEEEDNDDDGEEEQPETKPETSDDENDTLVESWETENDLVFELHGLDGADEVIVIEEDENGNQKDAAIALSVEDLDEAMEILKEIRGMMIERAVEREAVRKVRVKPKA